MYPLWTSSPILLFHMESADQRRSTFRVVGAASYDTMKRQTHHRVHLPLDVCAARLSSDQAVAVASSAGCAVSATTG